MNADRKWRPATAVAHLGRRPKEHLGTVNTPVYRASTILFDSVAELESAVAGTHPGVVYGLHGMPTVTDLQAAFAALEGGLRCAGRTFRPRRDHAGTAGRDAQGRSCAGHRLGLRPDSPLLRESAQGFRCRRQLLRSAARRRDRQSVPQQHQGRVHRIARFALVRSAGHPGDCGSGASTRRTGHARQYLGDTARVPVVCARGRRRRARRYQVSRRPLRRADRSDHLQRGDVSAHAPPVHRHGRDRERRRLLPGAARPAHAGAASTTAHCERAAHCAVVARPTRRRRGDLSRAAGIARPRTLAARFHRRVRVCSASCSSPWRRNGSTRCSMACGCSRWASAGVASRA